MSEITIPLVFFIILCFSTVGVVVSYICDRIDKTIKRKLDAELERYKHFKSIPESVLKYRMKQEDKKHG